MYSAQHHVERKRPSQGSPYVLDDDGHGCGLGRGRLKLRSVHLRARVRVREKVCARKAFVDGAMASLSSGDILKSWLLDVGMSFRTNFRSVALGT